MTKWFCEKVLPGEKRGAKLLIQIKKKLFSVRSPFQKIEVVETPMYGRMLILDGVVQLAKNDEFIYHEMLAHTPLIYHPNPQKILVIGGGDGGILRETLKHPIKEVILSEIDSEVVKVSQKYLPFVSKDAFKDSRVKIYYEDGAKFIKKFKNYFDVVIIDATDPSDLSFPLLKSRFYQNLKMALKKKGVVAVQSGGMVSFWKWIKYLWKLYQKNFTSVKIHRFNVPSFIEAEWSITIGGKNIDLKKTTLNCIRKRRKKIKGDLKYYSPEIHFYSGILPKYLQKDLNP